MTKTIISRMRLYSQGLTYFGYKLNTLEARTLVKEALTAEDREELHIYDKRTAVKPIVEELKKLRASKIN